MPNVSCTNVSYYPVGGGKIRCRFLLTLLDDQGHAVLSPSDDPYTHGYIEPTPPPGFEGDWQKEIDEGRVASGLEYEFPSGTDTTFHTPGAPTSGELTACITRVKNHWLAQLAVPGGPLGPEPVAPTVVGNLSL